MAAVGELLQPPPQQSKGVTLLGGTENAVVASPEDLQGHGRQGITTTGKTAGTGEAGQGLGPARTGEMPGGDLEFRLTHILRGIGEGTAAEAPPDSR